ncbi:choice-of-anchor D domain-containing protein [Candidatus Albibeggiatoa sp. nov. NOAA]|uniref:choice-of-anchor D domain-containing protein n=1 Tax=Candidatus Albibeggiatoa sp. nov. NOAA TaxID=3162724 RepID=UPI003303C924|nr:choice-of-anchor D domain-containing protein [Thiotrichaceae bacterium]
MIAGGTFIADPSNSESFNSIAKWNGTSWEPLGDGFGGYVYALTLDNEGNLIAGGTFYSNFLHNQRLNYIAKWNGTEWEPISEGFNDSVYTLTLDSEGHLVAGGIFNSTSSNTERMSHVAKWNGSSWEPLGNGLDSAVYSLTLDNEGNLIAGGSFEQADNIASAYLAKWKPPIVNFELIEQSIEESSTSFDLAVQLSEASRHTISIPFSVGAASSINDDYSISASPLTINAGDTEAQLSITIDNDVISESDEKLIINMGSLTNANKGSKTQFTLTITDDDIVEVAVKEGSNELTTSTTIDLGRINIGESLSKTLTVENTGSIDLVLSSISLTGAFNFTDTVSTDLTISANSSVDLTIELSDTSIAGDYTGTLSFTTNDNDEPNFSFSLVGSVTDSNSLSDSDIDNSDNSSDSDNNTENNDDSPDENQTNSEESTGKVHIHSDRYLLGVAGHLAHIKSNPSGINCEYGEGSCTAMFDRGTNVQLELVKIKTADGFSQEDYNITWDGTDSGCAKQSVTMNNGIRCLVKVHGKQGMDYSSGNSNNAGNTTHSTTTENEPVTGQLELLNFSGHSTLNGGEEDVILGFILEGDGTTDVILHADILDAGVMPQLDLNQVIIDEQSIRGDLLKRHQHSENFILEHTVGEGIYTLQMSSLGVKGRGMAGISLKNNQLDLTNLSVRGHLKDFLVLSFIVSGEGTQKARINTRVLSGGVVTELHLLNLSTQQGLVNESIAEGKIIEISAGAYAILLKVIEGEGIGMIEADLVQ